MGFKSALKPSSIAFQFDKKGKTRDVRHEQRHSVEQSHSLPLCAQHLRDNILVEKVSDRLLVDGCWDGESATAEVVPASKISELVVENEHNAHLRIERTLLTK